MWVIVGCCFVGFHLILLSTFEASSIDHLLLFMQAITPAIWIGRNGEIIEDFMRYFYTAEEVYPIEPHPNMPGDLENSWGGVWVGH